MCVPAEGYFNTYIAPALQDLATEEQLLQSATGAKAQAIEQKMMADIRTIVKYGNIVEAGDGNEFDEQYAKINQQGVPGADYTYLNNVLQDLEDPVDGIPGDDSLASAAFANDGAGDGTLLYSLFSSGDGKRDWSDWAYDINTLLNPPTTSR